MKRIRPKIWFTIHSWIGITAGLMLFVICWSGTVAVFSNELDWLLNPSIRATETIENEIDWQRAVEVFRDNFQEGDLIEINAPSKKGYSIEGWAQGRDGYRFRFYLDPVTYELIETTSYFNVQRFFRSFHMALFEAGFFNLLGVPIGYFVVGLFGLVLLISGITGLLFYKKWRTGFFRLEIHKGLRRLWSDVHKLMGLWSVWFVLLIGLTGTWYLLEWWLPEPPYSDTTTMADLDKNEFFSISSLLDKAMEAYPELNIQRIGFYDFDKGLLYFEGDDGSLLVRKRAAFVMLDACTGDTYHIQRPSELSAYLRWWETVDLLHFGKFAGLWSKWLWFIFGLALSALCLTGAYLQAKRQKLKSGVKSHRVSVLIAYGLTLLLLALSIIAGWQEIKGYGVNGHWPGIPLSVIVFIGLWVLTIFFTLGWWIRAVR